jgi:protein phosphatase
MNRAQNVRAASLCVLSGAVAFAHSDTGSVRQRNEDHYLLAPELHLLAVADGMGGHEAGALASLLALETLQDCLARRSAEATWLAADPDATCREPSMQAVAVLHEALASVNALLYARNAADQMIEGSGMGTTLTGFWRPHVDGPLLAFHVGDSRLYRYRAGSLEQLSRDQTWYQQALDAGHLDRLPARNVLLQAIGPAPRVEPEIRAHAVQTGDLLLLCSDGLHGSVAHHEIARVLHSADATNLPASSDRLIRLAADYESRDNVTVVLVRYT